MAIHGPRMKEILSKCASVFTTVVQRQRVELCCPLKFHPEVTYHSISHFFDQNK